VFLHETKSKADDDDTSVSTSPPEENAGVVAIDIFTAHAEVPFAGHPTIGTSHFLLNGPSQQQKKDAREDGAVVLTAAPSSLLTKAGKIPISKLGNGVVGALIPHNVHIHAATLSTPWASRPNPIVSIVKGMTFALVELESLEALAAQNGSLWAAGTYVPDGLDEGWNVGIVCTYFYVVVGGGGKGEAVELRTRMFGTIEDPATGSAASALSSWLSLQRETGTEEKPFEYVLTQGVEMGRKSVIGLRITRTGDGKGIESVLLSGTAVEVMNGNIMVE